METEPRMNSSSSVMSYLTAGVGKRDMVFPRAGCITCCYVITKQHVFFFSCLFVSLFFLLYFIQYICTREVLEHIRNETQKDRTEQ